MHLASPFERLQALLPDLPVQWDEFRHSPITGIHLWFDRVVTGLPHATLLDRTIQWMFNKRDGRYLQFVVSASRSLVEMPRAEVIELALREAAEFFPAIGEAKLERAQVIKEVRATAFRRGRRLEKPASRRAATPLRMVSSSRENWTRSGWPATMEGAVRSGYIAAEAVAQAAA